MRISFFVVAVIGFFFGVCMYIFTVFISKVIFFIFRFLPFLPYFIFLLYIF